MSEDKRELAEEKDIKQRGQVAGFFISGWNNIVRMMASNVLYIIFNIPSLFIGVAYSFIFLPVLIPAFKWESFVYVQLSDGTSALSSGLFILLMFFFITFMLSGLLVCIGPFQAGFNQVYKDIRGGTSFSFFGSFRNGLKNNWKKSLGAMFIGILVSAIILLAVSFYMNMHTTAGTVIGAVFVVLLFAFILIQNFVYQMIISTDLKLSRIYKNAVLFLFIRFVPCIGASLLVFLFYFMIPFVLLMSSSYVTLGIFVFFYTFIVISWMQFFLSSFASGLIEKYVAADD